MSFSVTTFAMVIAVVRAALPTNIRDDGVGLVNDGADGRAVADDEVLPPVVVPQQKKGRDGDETDDHEASALARGSRGSLLATANGQVLGHCHRVLTEGSPTRFRWFSIIAK